MIFLKKTLILIFLALVIIILCQNKSQKVITPKESIRIRIIANSNNNVDINKKLKVKKEVETKIYELLEEFNYEENICFPCMPRIQSRNRECHS